MLRENDGPSGGVPSVPPWPRYYELLNREPVLVGGADAITARGRLGNRRIACHSIGGLTVSTVFLALDHAYASTGSDSDKPVLFETMLFVDSAQFPDPVFAHLREEPFRTATYRRAERCHAGMLVLLRRVLTRRALRLAAGRDCAGLRRMLEVRMRRV